MVRKLKVVEKNFIYNSIYQIFAIIVPLFTTPYLSRTLGVEGIGQYAYAYSIVYYFSIFITLGLNSYGNRTIAIIKKDSTQIATTFWNIYAMQILGGMIVFIAYILFCVLWNKSSLINYVMIGVIISSCLDITWFFYGMEEFKKTTIRDIVIKIITIICIFGLIHNESDVWKYALIRSLSFLIAQGVLWLPLVKKVSFVTPKLCLIIKHIKPNLVLFIPTIAVSIYKIMDKIMLGAIAGETEVGYYESCEKVIQVPMALITALGVVMLPYMANFYSKDKNDKSEAMILIRNSEHLMVILSSVIGFGIMAIAKEFVPVFYGKGYDKCIILFYILLPSCIFLAFANVIRTQYLIPNKYDKEYIASLIIGAVTNLFMNILLIPKLQSIGAAIGTLIAEMVVCIVQIYEVKKELPIIKILQEGIAYIFISGLMFVIGILLPISNYSLLTRIIIKIIICGITWLIMMSIHFIKINIIRGRKLL